MPDSRPPLTHLPLKLLARIRARGVREVASLGIQRIRESWSSTAILIVLTRAASGPVPPRDDLEARWATSADAPLYAHDIGTDSATSFTWRLSETTRCFVVVSRARLVHATWVTTGAAWTREVRGYLQPPAGHAYVYESFTRPEVRGLGIYTFALEAIAAVCASEGFERLWVAVESDNPSSLRAVTKAAFSPAFEISYRRRAGRLAVRTSSLQSKGRTLTIRSKDLVTEESGMA